MLGLLEELRNQTKLPFRQLFETASVFDGIKRFARVNTHQWLLDECPVSTC
jgi:hypothetical protein